MMIISSVGVQDRILPLLPPPPFSAGRTASPWLVKIGECARAFSSEPTRRGQLPAGGKGGWLGPIEKLALMHDDRLYAMGRLARERDRS
jgi:hypothetical protein